MLDHRVLLWRIFAYITNAPVARVPLCTSMERVPPNLNVRFSTQSCLDSLDPLRTLALYLRLPESSRITPILPRDWRA
jgi:hypothetical protein